MKKACANPSCKPSLERNAKKCQKILPITSAPHLERQKYPRRAQKSDLTSVSELCYVQMREKHPQYISSPDL